MKREEAVARLESRERWDVIVVGGGATGLGSALDAVSRGFRTLLVEAGDFGQETSSRSTKLIHGGVRYLATGQVGLVREALRERGLLLKLAPHIVHPRTFLVPAYSWLDRPYFGTGMALYDLLAGRQGFGRSHIISRREALERVPTLHPASLRGGVVYDDGQFDDARMSIALARTVDDRGGVVLNHARVVRLLREAGRVVGVVVLDTEAAVEHEVRGRVVVNATGVFADDLRRLEDPGQGAWLRPSRGSHVVLDRRFLPGETAVLIPKTDDGRVLFAIPWLGKVLLGTTDLPVEHAVAGPQPERGEVEYLLEHARRYLEPAPGAGDVLATFAGLRPLLGAGSGNGDSTSRLSREHALLVSPGGLVTIAGGKWTTYRRMAIETIDRALEVGELPRRPSGTESIPLHGAGPATAYDALWPGYGTDAEALEALASERAEWSAPIHEALPYRGAHVVWAARAEWARTVEDVLSRRTRALVLDARASVEAAPAVARLLAAELRRDAAWVEGEIEGFRQLAAAGLAGLVR